jgi:hypothetical protein
VSFACSSGVASRSPARRALLALLLAGTLVVAACQVAVIVSDLSPAVPAAYVFSDDAFYALTVARNVATGHGITIDGVHATNGFQPLWTALMVALYRAFPADRVVFGLAYLLSALCWGLACWLFARLVAAYTPDGPHRAVALGFAVLCFAADRDVQSYFFSGLETGLYATLLLACLLLWPKGALTRGSAAGLGALLGALMLARNDGVFFAGAFLASALAWRRRPGGLAPVAAAGLVAAALLLPWLIFNQALGGTIVPQSGAATNLGVNAYRFGPAKLVAALRTVTGFFVTPFVPISRLSGSAVLALGGLALALITVLAVREVQRRRELAALAVPYLGACALLIGYYLTFSGGVWFYPRYFMPVRIAALFLPRVRPRAAPRPRVAARRGRGAGRPGLRRAQPAPGAGGVRPGRIHDERGPHAPAGAPGPGADRHVRVRAHRLPVPGAGRQPRREGQPGRTRGDRVGHVPRLPQQRRHRRPLLPPGVPGLAGPRVPVLAGTPPRRGPPRSPRTRASLPQRGPARRAALSPPP